MARYKFIGSKERTDDGSEHPIKHHEARPRAFQTPNRAHWEAPAVMVATVLCGVAFAIGHDRFYHHFDNQPVGSGLQQKVIINVGTAFAFLVKMFFTIATATVFSQQIFQSLKRRAETINDIDSLFDIFDNILHFVKLGLWFRHFALAVIAIVVWCIPIAAVFTPGTIHVAPDLAYNNNTQLKTAQPQQSWIGKQNFGNTQIDYTALFKVGDQTYSSVVLNSPSGTLYAVAVGSVGRQDILPIPPPSQNASYQLSFYGPALSCSSSSAKDLSTYQDAIKSARRAQDLAGMHTTLEGVESVIADDIILKYNAFIENTNFGYDLKHPNWNNGTADSAKPTTDGTIYIYFSPRTKDILLACSMHNATYNVGFSFEDSVQAIDVRSVDLHERVPWNETINVDSSDYANTVYNSMLFAFNDIVIAAAINDTTPGATTNGILYYNGAVSMSALRQYIEGDSPLDANTAIATLQDMFTNLTISTLSQQSLRLTNAQAKTIRVSTWRSVNVWKYDPEDLYIAYGCALLATVLCVIWGIYLVLQHNHLSYSIKFSTFLRTTRRKELDGLIAPEDRKGNDPLPKDMKAVKLTFGNTGVTGSQDSDGFRLAQSRGEDEISHVQPHMNQDGQETLTFLPQIPDSTNTPTPANPSQHVRRKPVPDVSNLTTNSNGTRIFG